MVSVKEVSDIFFAIGSEKRLSVFLTLINVYPEGLDIKTLQGKTNIPASTLAHHLKILVDCGIVKQRRNGRQTVCIAEASKMEVATKFLLEDCCK